MVTEYWARHEHTPFFKRLGLPPSDMPKTVPLAFHADGVRIYKRQKAYVYSCSSMCRKGPSLSTKIILLAIKEGIMIKDKTHDDIGKLMGHVCEVLRTGCFPHADENGDPFPENTLQGRRAGRSFAGGWKCSFSAWKGDWEARVQVHKLPRNYSCTYICERCPAARNDYFNFGDFRPEASHMQIRFDHSQYLLLNPPGRTSSWTAVKGWSIDRNLEDFVFLRVRKQKPERLTRVKSTPLHFFVVCSIITFVWRG